MDPITAIFLSAIALIFAREFLLDWRGFFSSVGRVSLALVSLVTVYFFMDYTRQHQVKVALALFACGLPICWALSSKKGAERLWAAIRASIVSAIAVVLLFTLTMTIFGGSNSADEPWRCSSSSPQYC